MKHFYSYPDDFKEYLKTLDIIAAMEKYLNTLDDDDNNEWWTSQQDMESNGLIGFIDWVYKKYEAKKQRANSTKKT